jgi:hypothetical protein
VDDAFSAYVDWREECAGVWDAYARWTGAAGNDVGRAYAAYGAALDREEAAAHHYADLIDRVGDELGLGLNYREELWG